MEKELSIYIHIPFCKSKCYYCDFVSYENMSEDVIQNYIDALIKEILTNAEIISSRKIKTIYIGGGTPSFIDAKYIKQILDTIYMITSKENIEEITIEINPATIDDKKAKMYFESGINRVSLGLQTIYDDILKIIGRKHTYNDFISALEILNNANFENISCDLIYPLPNLTYEKLEQQLDKILEFREKYNIKHISIYNLEIHENTKLDFLIKEGYVKLPDEDEEYNMRNLINQKLEQAGFNKYEISNYSLPSYESVHNKVYWKQDEYLGFGVNAASYINGTRYSNIKNIDEYIKNINEGIDIILNKEEQTLLDKMKEYVILNLRLMEGVDIDKFYIKFKKDIYDIFLNEINELINLKLIKKENKKISLTPRGEEVANQVWERFI